MEVSIKTQIIVQGFFFFFGWISPIYFEMIKIEHRASRKKGNTQLGYFHQFGAFFVFRVFKTGTKALRNKTIGYAQNIYEPWIMTAESETLCLS